MVQVDKESKGNVMMNKITLIIALASVLEAHAITSDKCNQDLWVTNGLLRTIAPAGNKIFIGGDFTEAGPFSGGWVHLNSSTGKPH